MDYTIEPSADGSFIIVKIRGDITRRAAMEMNLEAHALGKRLKINRYLVDVTEARNVDTIGQNYSFAHSDMVNVEGINRSAVIATVARPSDHSHDFIETVSRNAGLNVTIFRDLNKAKRFLTELSARKHPDPENDDAHPTRDVRNGGQTEEP